jgi:transposase
MGSSSFAGIDWASRRHALCVVDRDGEILSDGFYPHSEAGIRELLAKMGEREVCRVAIERADGLLVDRLVEAGLSILPINPGELKATRRRYSGSGRKSDSFDAFCLAELARTDAHRYQALVPDSDETRALRALTRARENMIQHKVGAVRQLRGQLDSFWPGAAKIFPGLDSAIALAFLRLYPSPADARELGEEGLVTLRRENSSSRIRRSPAELLERLRSAPQGFVGETESEGRRTAVLGLVSLLEVTVAEEKRLTTAIIEATHAHPDGRIFLSPFRTGNLVTPAHLIVGFGDDRTRYPSADILAAKAGVVPVARQSGTRHSAFFRRACDRRLRSAVSALADATRRHNPWAKAVYASARERGHRHSHALRILGRAWLRVLWRCWQDRVPYDPAKHGGLRRLETAEAPDT